MIPAALIGFYFPVLAGFRFFWGDAADFYPTASYVASSLHHFHIPYWSPYISAGFPTWDSVPYPPNWLLSLFVGPDGRLSYWVYELMVILHLLIAGLSTYGLAREWKLSNRASAYAGLTFMLSGFMSARTTQPGVVVTLAWFPLALLLVSRALNHRRLAPALGAGLVMGLAALGGHPQMLMHMAYALALYVVAFVVKNWRTQGWKTLLRGAYVLTLVGLVGVAISAARYLPILDFVRYSDRSSSSVAFLTDCSLYPGHLLTLLVPKAFGSVTGPTGLPGPVPHSLKAVDYSYVETVIYVGVLPLLLCGFALTDRTRSLRWFLALLALGALVLALGCYTPVYRIAMAVLPGFSLFRIPARLSDLFTFAACVMAGLGMDAFLREGAEPRARRWLVPVALCAGWAVLVWALLASGLLRGQHRLWDPKLDNLTRQWLIFTVLSVVATGIIFWRTRSNWSPVAGYWLVVAVTFLDLLAFGHDVNASHVRPTQIPFAPSGAVDHIRQESKQEIFRTSMSGGSRFRLGSNRGNLDHVEMLQGYTGWVVARLAQVGGDRHILDLLNVRYEIDPTGQRLIPNPTYLPRARMVYQYQVATSDSAALETVRGGTFDYRGVAILEHDPGFPSGSNDETRNDVVITRREANRMELQVQTDVQGILVLSEVYLPQWKALVDGRPATIYPVDYVLRGLTLNAGSHHVEMYYDGSLIRLGSLVSLLTLVITFGLILTLRRNRNARRSLDGIQT
ncbi:MAG TPA: YfhO family protein [bacterium]|nr:YfhO family protein [bacterium]